MTKKNIKLKDKMDIAEIQKGTVLKTSSDMFIVAEVFRDSNRDPIHDALFNSKQVGTYAIHATRPRQGAVYSLISLSQGSCYYGVPMPLQSLLSNISSSKAKFEVVNSIDFVENN